MTSFSCDEGGKKNTSERNAVVITDFQLCGMMDFNLNICHVRKKQPKELREQSYVVFFAASNYFEYGATVSQPGQVNR